MGKRGVGVVVASAVCLAALSACTDSKSATAPNTSPATATSRGPVTTPPATVTTVRRHPTTTTTTPEYSFDDSVPPPRLVNTGTDYVAIVKSLEAYGNWIAAHRPDPSRVATINAPGTVLFDVFTRDLTRLQKNGQRLVETITRPSTFTIVSVSADAFSARAVEEIVSRTTIGSNGRTRTVQHYIGPTTYIMVAVLVQGHWYLDSVANPHSPRVHL